MFSSPGDSDLFQKYKQQTYRLAFPFGTLVTVLYVIVVAQEGSLPFYLGISMAILLFVLSLLVWKGTRRLSAIEFVFYFVVMTYFFILTQLSVNLALMRAPLTPSDLADPLNSLALWLVIFMLAGFLTLSVAQARWLIGYAFAGTLAMCANNLFTLASDGQLSIPILFRWVNPLAGLLITLLLLQRMGVLQQRRATTDALTGLLNRHALYGILEQEIERANRYGHIFSIVLFDIDHFKKVNDTLGHMTGDRILVEISRHMAQIVRRSDHIGRWGGEEFLLILPETEIEPARILAERVRQLLSDIQLDGGQIVTASFGVTGYQRGTKLSSLLQCADAALYSAKHNGRNQVFTLICKGV